METQQLGHTPRSGPEVKNGRSGAEDGVQERLGCGTVKEEVSQILQRVSASAEELGSGVECKGGGCQSE